MTRIKWTKEDVNNVQAKALEASPAFAQPEGFHMMPDGTIMSDNEMAQQDVAELTGVPIAPPVEQSLPDNGGIYP